MSTPILELENVSAAYSTYRALFGVSLVVPEDGIIALVGSNGSGKSTLARVVSGLVPASGGMIRVAGEDVTRFSAHRISRLGVVHVPEGRAIFSSLSVEENLTVSFSRRLGRKGTSAALARAYQAFPVLAERRKQLGGTLSGGQQRILSLAKVLAVPPKLLIVDELSLGLAPVIVDQVYDGLIAIHQEGCALLVVEQQVDRVLAIADRAVLLVKGAVAWEGPARDARPTLEARMLGGGPSANGVAPISTNGAAPPPYVAGPTLARQSFRSPGGPGGTSSAAPPADTSPAGTSPAPQGDPGAPTAAPGGPDAAASSQGGAGAPAPAPGGSRESSDHPSDLWVVGPTFPDTN
ncbi:MAG: ABC transporter ATP-binding protein [Acidimicrobiales bacterium]|nr:ABC transporter ATP-binding protein [Acidimicrobiales bacterium]